jgi:hypothetical protein
MAGRSRPRRRTVWSLLRLTQNPAGLCRRWTRRPRLSYAAASPDHSFGRGTGATLISPHRMQNGGYACGGRAPAVVAERDRSAFRRAGPLRAYPCDGSAGGSRFLLAADRRGAGRARVSASSGPGRPWRARLPRSRPCRDRPDVCWGRPGGSRPIRIWLVCGPGQRDTSRARRGRRPACLPARR